MRVDRDFTPASAREPAVVLDRFKPSSMGTVDYLVEWATGERRWVIEHGVHDVAWDPKTGAGCSCGLGDNLSRFRIPQI